MEIQKPTERPNQQQKNELRRFFVTEDCISCGLCREMSPAIFRESGDGATFEVYQQPESREAEAEAYDAMDRCPVEAIQSLDVEEWGNAV